jgi:hypothetical protein
MDDEELDLAGDVEGPRIESRIEQIARAFSSHRFADAYPYLRAAIEWNMVGGDLLTGRDAVIVRCDASAAYLAGVITTFDRFKVIVGDQGVAVDSVATYVDRNGETTVVASCDLYDFINGTIAEITSYTVEVSAERSESGG